MGHYRRSKGELIRDVLLWTPSHSRAEVGRSAKTYQQQLCSDTGCNLKDLPGEMDDRDEWRERVWEIRTSGMMLKQKYIRHNKIANVSDVVIESKQSITTERVQEYKTKHNWVGKVIYWELCKKLKFNHTNKWYLHNLGSVPENETHSSLGFWDTNKSLNLSQTARPSDRKKKKLKKKKKRIWRIGNFAVPKDHIVKLKESEKRDR